MSVCHWLSVAHPSHMVLILKDHEQYLLLKYIGFCSAADSLICKAKEVFCWQLVVLW